MASIAIGDRAPHQIMQQATAPLHRRAMDRTACVPDSSAAWLYRKRWSRPRGCMPYPAHNHLLCGLSRHYEAHGSQRVQSLLGFLVHQQIAIPASSTRVPVRLVDSGQASTEQRWLGASRFLNTSKGIGACRSPNSLWMTGFSIERLFVGDGLTSARGRGCVKSPVSCRRWGKYLRTLRFLKRNPNLRLVSPLNAREN